jgi:hypothetical protein
MYTCLYVRFWICFVCYMFVILQSCGKVTRGYGLCTWCTHGSIIITSCYNDVLHLPNWFTGVAVFITSIAFILERCEWYDVYIWFFIICCWHSIHLHIPERCTAHECRLLYVYDTCIRVSTLSCMHGPHAHHLYIRVATLFCKHIQTIKMW